MSKDGITHGERDMFAPATFDGEGEFKRIFGDIFGDSDADNLDRRQAKVMEQMARSQALQRPEAVAQRKAEQEARDAARDDERRAWQAEQAERVAAEKRESSERAEREQADRDARWAAMIEEGVAERARIDAAVEALERQDDDYHALVIKLSFTTADDFNVEGDMEDWHNPGLWELNEDETLNTDLIAKLTTEIREAIAPWVTHYHSMGVIRADNIHPVMMGDEPGDGQCGPAFYLVYRGSDAVLRPETLGELAKVQLDLATAPGAKLTLSAEALPTNATLLHAAAQRCGSVVGQWGGDATPDLTPAPEESRDEWLERVCIPSARLGRLLERWRRSGSNVTLFGTLGSATERSSGNLRFEWLIPGLLPRGYVTLLVGTKEAGKSTLLGEICAVVDSECQSPRSVLGIEVEARGVGGIVSGEDGEDFVNSRERFYTPTHGEPLGFVFDTATRPWSEVLKLLYEFPKIDFLGIDGLRSVMEGDEDSSGRTSEFFDDLNRLARFHNCAIALVHHLSKKIPRSLSDMLPAVRGSGAITDRPRMVIGMIDRGAGLVEIGIIKCNIPPSEMLWGERNVGRLFRQDSDTLTLVPVEKVGRNAGATGGSSVLEQVLGAIGYHNQRHELVRRTGRHSLYARKSPQLIGAARSAIEEGVAALVASGRLLDGPEGLTLIEPTASETLA